MERLSRLLGALPLAGDPEHREQLATAAWPKAVGRRIASRARAVRIVRDSLIVEVDDSVWQRQLFQMSKAILAQLEKIIGPGVVQAVEFRVGAPKIPPQSTGLRQEAPAGPLFADEAERIEDPGLRRIYVASRKKALA